MDEINCKELDNYAAYIDTDSSALTKEIIRIIDRSIYRIIIGLESMPLFQEKEVMYSIKNAAKAGKQFDFIATTDYKQSEIVKTLKRNDNVEFHFLRQTDFFIPCIPDPDTLGWDKNYMADFISAENGFLYLLPHNEKEIPHRHCGVIIHEKDTIKELNKHTKEILNHVQEKSYPIRIELEPMLNRNLLKKYGNILTEKYPDKWFLVQMGKVIGTFSGVDEADEYVLKHPELLAGERLLWKDAEEQKLA